VKGIIKVVFFISISSMSISWIEDVEATLNKKNELRLKGKVKSVIWKDYYPDFNDKSKSPVTNGEIEKMDFNINGKVTFIFTKAGGHILTEKYKYNNKGKIIEKKTTNDANNNPQTYQYTYNSKDQLSKIMSFERTDSTAFSKQIFDYDNNGRIIH
jgi:hypothetical protein